MEKILKYIIILFFSGITIGNSPIYGQSAIGQLERMTGQKINRSSSSSAISSSDISNVIAGALFQAALNTIFSNNSAKNQKGLEAQNKAAELAAQQYAQQQIINQQIAQAEYNKMMESYKFLGDSQDLKIKTIGNTNLNFKTINGEAENLASDARNQFENNTVTPVTVPSDPETATPFFGDTMSENDIQTLMNIENNPNVVDLRDAKKFIAEKTNKDSSGIVTLLRKFESVGNGEPMIQKSDCIILEKRLKGYINQRQQFQKTIDLSQSELTVWETANNNALINAAKDGVEYFTGEILQSFSNRGKAADRLQQRYDIISKQMAKDEINIVEIQAKIDRLRLLSSTGKVSEVVSNVNDWQVFIKDGMSSLISQLSNSNTEIKSMLEDPQMQKYFSTDAPELNFLLDISKLAASNMVFGKWVAKKMPLIACIEISTKVAYNGLDYFLSLNRILKAQKINGGVLDTAKYIQKNIDDTYYSLIQCPKN